MQNIRLSVIAYFPSPLHPVVCVTHCYPSPLICTLMLSHKRGGEKRSYGTLLSHFNLPRTCDHLNRKHKADLRSAQDEALTVVVVQWHMKRFQIHSGLIQVQHKSRPLRNRELWLSGLDCLFILTQEAFVFSLSITESPQ